MPKCIYLRMGKESKCRLADYDQGGPERARTGVAMNSQGRSMRETAEALGISLFAAKARLFHAKKALRRSEALADQQRHRSSR
jgi:hypothetical protein